MRVNIHASNRSARRDCEWDICINVCLRLEGHDCTYCIKTSLYIYIYQCLNPRSLSFHLLVLITGCITYIHIVLEASLDTEQVCG